MNEQSDDLENLLKNLKLSPMFNLSLSSKELFHSNFLAWLCSESCYKEQVGQIFASYLEKPLTAGYTLKVFRERYNIDLTLEFSHNGIKHQLIIENKVKSIPNLDQLKLYTKNILVKSKADTTITETSFLLLSLTKPAFLDEATQRIFVESTKWHYLSYHELADKLDKLLSLQTDIASKNPYHGQILKDYIGFISQLQGIYKFFTINSDNLNSDFFIEGKYHNHIKENRLHDLVDKLRYSQLAELISQKLVEYKFEITKDNWCDAKHGQIFVKADMTRGIGLCEFKYIFRGRGYLINLGVQVQGQAFRLFVESNKKGKAQAVANQLYSQNCKKLWFDFSNVPGDSEKKYSGEYPTKGDFNNYSGICYYRSKYLPAHISTKNIIDLIVQLACFIQEHREEIQQHINAKA